MQALKFRSPADEPVHVAVLSGHAALVGPDWRELPPILHRQAIADGCITDNMPAETIAAALESATPPFSQESAIQNGIIKMLDADNPGENFTRAGLPNLNVLSHTVGFNVDREQVQKVWAAMEQSSAAEA